MSWEMSSPELPRRRVPNVGQDRAGAAAGNINITNSMKKKDTYEIEKDITEVTRNIKELEITIMKITKENEGDGRNSVGDSELIDMLNDMMREGNEIIAKLVDI